MREILYRGKKADNGEWVYGDLSKWSNGYFISLQSQNIKARTHIEVYPETVGQYTGLKDKNGTKIFEGDIVRVSRGKDIETGEIQYNKYGVWVIVYDKFYCNTFPYIFTSSDSNVWIKVIGNIHDNPELLNAEDSL